MKYFHYYTVLIMCWNLLIFVSFRVTLGNQVDGVKLVDPDIVRNFKKVYPDGNCMKPATK